MIKCIVIVLLLLGYDVSKVALQECIPKNSSCDVEIGEPCCEGFWCLNSLIWGPYCTCTERGWSLLPGCSMDSHCCAGHGPCNTQQYCGCISYGFVCTAGRSDECCNNNVCQDVGFGIYNCK